jgi:hypothetical protein
MLHDPIYIPSSKWQNYRAKKQVSRRQALGRGGGRWLWRREGSLNGVILYFGCSGGHTDPHVNRCVDAHTQTHPRACRTREV